MAKRCKKCCGFMYKDWFGDMVCVTCGYSEYEEIDEGTEI